MSEVSVTNRANIFYLTLLNSEATDAFASVFNRVLKFMITHTARK